RSVNSLIFAPLRMRRAEPLQLSWIGGDFCSAISSRDDEFFRRMRLREARDLHIDKSSLLPRCHDVGFADRRRSFRPNHPESAIGFHRALQLAKPIEPLAT